MSPIVHQLSYKNDDIIIAVCGRPTQRLPRTQKTVYLGKKASYGVFLYYFESKLNDDKMEMFGKKQLIQRECRDFVRWLICFTPNRPTT